MFDPVTITLTESEVDAVHYAIVKRIAALFDEADDLTDTAMLEIDILDNVLNKLSGGATK